VVKLHIQYQAVCGGWSNNVQKVLHLTGGGLFWVYYVIRHTGNVKIVPTVAEPFVLIPPAYTSTHCYELTLCIYDVKVWLALAVRAELICRNIDTQRKLTHNSPLFNFITTNFYTLLELLLTATSTSGIPTITAEPKSIILHLHANYIPSLIHSKYK